MSAYYVAGRDLSAFHENMWVGSSSQVHDLGIITGVPGLQMRKLKSTEESNLPKVTWLVSGKARFEPKQFMPESTLHYYPKCSQIQ